MDNDMDVKREARKQYLKYFLGWFIVLGIVLFIFVIKLITNLLVEDGKVRTNLNAPSERVYDEADVLTDEEENKLREQIAKAEAEIACDIVIVTIDQPVEGSEAESYGYRYNDWDLNMRDIADDFYDYNGFGYDATDYDGALILDNWYEGQAGTWLSTSGAVYEEFSTYDIDRVLDEVDYTLKNGGSAYTAYSKAVKKIVSLMKNDSSENLSMGNFVLMAIFIPAIVAGIFIAVKMKSKEGKVTTNSTTYMDGKAQMNRQADDFIRKTVSTRRIPRNSSSGSHGSSGGHGGSHRSSSGRSHGGGGRRR